MSMLKVLQVFTVAALLVLGTSAVQAQFVEMSGDYGEASGRIVNIPQNPPYTICGAGGVLNAPPAAPGDARCKGARITVNATPLGPFQYAAPLSGVPVVGGHRVIPGGLLKGSTFTVPTQALGQPAPATPVGGEVVNNVVIWLDTTFQARLPAAARVNAPPASTRQMRKQGTGVIPGQPGRPIGAPAVRNVIMNNTSPPSSDFGNIVYKEGPNKFGGTMASLLNGTATLFLKTAAFSSLFGQPVLGTQPVGVPGGSLMSRNGAGWNYPVSGGQGPGKIFGPAGSNIVPCGTGIPAAPPGCNVPTFATNAITLDVGNFLPAANSTKYFFPWTTGTVTAVVHAVRGVKGTFTETLTGMGYDTTTATPGVRNVGLVAGSYTTRTAAGATELGSQMIGVNLRFTPEPGATAALFAGIGLIGLVAARRRS